MDTSLAPTRLTDLPSWLLGQASTKVGSVVSRVLADRGARRSDVSILACLDQFGSMSQAAIGERVHLDRSDLVRFLDALGGAGHVVRSPDPADRRRNRVEITEAGRARLAALDAALRSAQDEALAALTPDERDTLKGLLTKLL